MSDFKPYDPNADTTSDVGFDPPVADGTYNGSKLTDAKALTSKAGNDGVLLEWETTSGAKWVQWLGFKTEQQSAITWADVAKLGIGNPADIHSLDELDAALKNAIGGYYDIAVKTNGQYRNTYINGPSTGSNPVVQEQVAAGFGVGMDGPPPATGGDDIPF